VLHCYVARPGHRRALTASTPRYVAQRPRKPLIHRRGRHRLSDPSRRFFIFDDVRFATTRNG